MGATQAGQALAGYRDTVTELIQAGEPFDDAEEAQQHEARTRLSAVQ